MPKGPDHALPHLTLACRAFPDRAARDHSSTEFVPPLQIEDFETYDLKSSKRRTKVADTDKFPGLLDHLIEK